MVRGPGPASLEPGGDCADRARPLNRLNGKLETLVAEFGPESEDAALFTDLVSGSIIRAPHQAPSGRFVPGERNGYPVWVLEVEDLPRRNIDWPGVFDTMSIEVVCPAAHLVLGADAEGKMIQSRHGWIESP
jgi:hypothetical protein